ncbi:E3 ubiquitin-protein ligase TRIM39-like isoform X2 [Colossoma macropomum]|uniref:E3 ubiquitin-protein ligase TRIM39-like isoform X2 n=1 Tax=Colossoma macropomum TaxID=42526 RepID=UPI00186482FB|nr:E3 ubiquitin-protein ligase TRIM39-like isoform X2 [Colossoma macropomum]
MSFPGEEMDVSKTVARPGSPSCRSEASDWSMEQPIALGLDPLDQKSKMMARPGSPSCRSLASDWSMEQPIALNGTEPLDTKSKKVDRPGSPSSRSALSSWSKEHGVDFKRVAALDNDSLLSGITSTADSGISMKTDRSHEDPQEHRLTSRYAEAGDVACDLCEGRKLRAYKSCMTCLASFCEAHVRDHYTVEALQRHLLVEVTKNLNILQENAQLKKIIREERSEKMDLRKEVATLKQMICELRQTICELRLPDFICKGKTPAAADLVLDPDTAHCALVLSNDGKRVRLGKEKTVDYSMPRFDKSECVLTTEGFSSGRHYWEVEVNREFTTGVTRESAQRKGRFSFSPARGYWCLYHFRQSFTALEEPSRRLPIDTVPRVLGVCVDVDEKWVAFYNAETKAHIYTFRQMDFADREKIYPVFNTLEKSVDLKIKMG